MSAQLAYGQCRRCRGMGTSYGQRYALPTTCPHAPWTTLRVAHTDLDNATRCPHCPQARRRREDWFIDLMGKCNCR